MKKYIGKGAEGTVYQVSPRRAIKEMMVTRDWEETHKDTLKALKRMAKSRKKTKYLCPFYGYSIEKNVGAGYRPHKVTLRMAYCKKMPPRKVEFWWEDTNSFKRKCMQEAKQLGLHIESDWHKRNVMLLNGRPVRIDYFPWYSQKWSN